MITKHVAICGFQGSGKDTMASILVSKYGYVQFSFASILKDIIALLFQWDRRMLDGTSNESRIWREEVDEWWATHLQIPHLTPRWVLQHIGTDVFRNQFHKDIWILHMKRKIIEFQNEMYVGNMNRIVISDCRFPNEFELLNELGFQIIHIQRGVLPRWFLKLQDGDIEEHDLAIDSDVDHNLKIHPSEYSFAFYISNQLDNVTHIYNDSTIDDLKETIAKLHV